MLFLDWHLVDVSQDYSMEMYFRKELQKLTFRAFHGSAKTSRKDVPAPSFAWQLNSATPSSKFVLVKVKKGEHINFFPPEKHNTGPKGFHL